MTESIRTREDSEFGKMKNANVELWTIARIEGLRQFQLIFGDSWIEAARVCNMGSESTSMERLFWTHGEMSELFPVMRQIRNHITGSPSELPDLRPMGKLTAQQIYDLGPGKPGA